MSGFVALAAVYAALLFLWLAIKSGRVYSPGSFDWRSQLGALNLAAADAVLKEDYHGPVVEQLNNGNLMLAMTEKNTEDISGRRFITPLHVGRNTGVGARGEGGTLPSAGNQRYEDIMGPTRYNYVRIQVSGPVIAAMARSRGAFIRAVDSEMNGAVDDGKRNFCRQIWGESNGRIAFCATTNPAALVINLDADTTEAQLRALEDMVVDVGTIADPDLKANAAVVESVDYDNLTVTLSGVAAFTTTSAHFIFAHDAGGASDDSGNPGDGQIELTGIQNMVDDTTVLHTLDPASEPRWKSPVYDNSGTPRAVAENTVNRALMQTEIRTGNVVDLLVGSDGVFRSYTDLLSSLKRFMDNVELKGGFEGVSISTARAGRQSGKKLSLTWDKDCPNFKLFGLTSSSFRFFEQADWDWLDMTGSIWLQVGDTHAYSATMWKDGEFVCQRRNANFRIDDLTEA